MRALLAAFVLLVGVSSTNAALCTSTLFEGTVTTCDCPPGSAPAGSYSQALPAGTYGGASDATNNAMAKANVALALCTDLLPGWHMVDNVKALPTECVASDGYCPGAPGAFKTAVDAKNVIKTTTAVDGAFTATKTTGAMVSLSTSKLINTLKLACDANAPNTGQNKPFTLEKCKVKDGWYVKTKAAAALVVIAQCEKGFVCATGQTGADKNYAPISCLTTGTGANNVGKNGGFICPALGTYGTAVKTGDPGLISTITGAVICGVGSGPKAAAKTCDPIPGYYGVTSDAGTGTPKTTPAQTACPTGVSSDALSAAFDTGCKHLAAGYTVDATVLQLTPGPLTNIKAAIKPCPANKYCKQVDDHFAFKGKSEALATSPAVTASAGSACPVGSGNALTPSAAGVNAISAAKGCIDLLPGYAFEQAADTKAFTTAVKACEGEGYGCVGSAGLFVDYGTTKSLDLGPIGLAASVGEDADLGHDADTGNLNDKVTVLTTANVKARLNKSLNVRMDCPDFSANTAFGVMSSCLTKVGYYIDHSAPTTPVACPVGEYCPGGAAVGTAGGNLNCPSGSVAPAAGTVISSNINECTVSEGYYIASDALTVPVPCLASSACAGGGPVGTAGGLATCPAQSTNKACIAAAAASTTTTVNLTPASQPITTTIDVAAPNVAAAVAPDVTVSNTVPSASSAASTVASMVVVTVAAIVAL